MREIAIDCEGLDWKPLLSDWRWLVPADHVPMLLGAFGDWIIAGPDGTVWNLDLLEGRYERIAADASQFHEAAAEEANMNRWLTADWATMAFERGLFPERDECLGWKIHPILGGPFSIENIEVFRLTVYQSLMAQMHRQIVR